MPGDRLKCSARTEVFAHITRSFNSSAASAKRCQARSGARFTTGFFRQGVHISADGPFHGPAARAHRHRRQRTATRTRRTRVLVRGATCTSQPGRGAVPLLAPLEDPGAHTDLALRSEPCASSSTEASGFSPALTSPSWSSPDVSELSPVPATQDVAFCIPLRLVDTHQELAHRSVMCHVSIAAGTSACHLSSPCHFRDFFRWRPDTRVLEAARQRKQQ